MIYFLVTAEHSYTMEIFRNSWGKGLAQEIKIIPYEHLCWGHDLQPGTYLFSDIERLPARQAEVLSRVWFELAKSPQAVRLINHPTQSLRRYELLRKLHTQGINDFNVYRLTENAQPQQFPVFIRKEADHLGNISPLLHSQEELDIAIKELSSSGYFHDDLIITEFIDTADEDGIYRKYAAFIIGDRILPRHLFFSKEWMVKLSQADMSKESFLAEEQAYADEHPHKEQLKEIFQLAGIQYGRIDYGIINGKVQVWEINTNPMLSIDGDIEKNSRSPLHKQFVERSVEAFRAMDFKGAKSEGITLAQKQKISEIADTLELRPAMKNAWVYLENKFWKKIYNFMTNKKH